MNDPLWQQVQAIAGYFGFAAYILYTMFYSGQVMNVIIKHNRKMANMITTTNSSMLILAWKALFHSFFSMAGVLYFTFYNATGMLAQDILILAGIHFCLNWTSSHKVVANILSKAKNKISPYEVSDREVKSENTNTNINTASDIYPKTNDEMHNSNKVIEFAAAGGGDDNPFSEAIVQQDSLTDQLSCA